MNVLDKNYIKTMNSINEARKYVDEYVDSALCFDRLNETAEDLINVMTGYNVVKEMENVVKLSQEICPKYKGKVSYDIKEMAMMSTLYAMLNEMEHPEDPVADVCLMFENAALSNDKIVIDAKDIVEACGKLCEKADKIKEEYPKAVKEKNVEKTRNLTNKGIETKKIMECLKTGV